MDGDPRPGWGGFLDVGAYEAGVPRVVAPVALEPAFVPACGGLDTVTAIVDLPAGLAPATGTPTVRVGEVLTASSAEVRGDRLLATFDRALLLGMLGGSATATLAVSGTVPGSVHFRGTASVEVAGPCAIGAAGAR